MNFTSCAEKKKPLFPLVETAIEFESPDKVKETVRQYDTNAYDHATLEIQGGIGSQKKKYKC